MALRRGEVGTSDQQPDRLRPVGVGESDMPPDEAREVADVVPAALTAEDLALLDEIIDQHRDALLYLADR